MNYERYQGVLTRFSVFGNDPLSAREDLMKRTEENYYLLKVILILISYLLMLYLLMESCFLRL